MLHFTTNDLTKQERFYRANLVNCITGFKPAVLIGTYKENGQPNLGIFSSVVHLGADPAMVGFINRPVEAAPHTIANIERTGVYTMNLVPAAFAAAAHHASAKFETAVNEFEATGFQTEIREAIEAPFVNESPVRFAMQLKEIIPVSFNRTFFVIGAVTDIFIQDDLLQPDGFIQLEKAELLSCLGLDGYYQPQLLNRFSYAKPGQPVHSILSADQ
jgi:flavin reductase (DIM6/NTAB) family NADH-FMN oxidoreductase RutF